MRNASPRTMGGRLRQLGFTTVEYAVAGAMLVTAIILAFTDLGSRVVAILDAILS